MARLSRLQRRIIQRVAEWYGWDEEDLRGPRKIRPVSRARQVAFLVLHEAGYSSPQIGMAMNRDHSTVLVGMRAARKRADASPLLRRELDEVRAYASSEYTPQQHPCVQASVRWCA